MPTTDMPLQHRTAEIIPLERAAEGAPSNRFKIVWTTGAAVRRYDWRSGKHYQEELVTSPNAVRLDRLNKGASVLNSHNSWDLDDVIGAVVPGTARMKGGEGEAEVDIDDGPENAAILRKIRSGMIRSISVGYVVHRYEKIEDEDGPDIWRATDWEPYEVSFVPIPADPGAGLRSGHDNSRTFPCEFINHQRKEHPMPPKKDAELAATPEAKAAAAEADKARRHDPEPAPAPSKEGEQTPEQIRAAAEAAERQRARDIRDAVRTAKLGEAFADKLIENGTSLDAARAQILTEMAARQEAEAPQTRSHVRVETGEGDRDKFLRGASAWLLTKAGVARMVEQQTKEKLSPGEFRGMTLLDLARECLERSGVSTRGMDKMTLAGTAFTHRSAITQGTTDFPVLLENVMHKTLLGAYETTPDTWSRFCKIGSVSDFRAHHRYRTGSFGVLDKVNENGEFKNKAIPDGEKESISAITAGNTINLTRQAIINDDMGAFNGLAAAFGRSAKLTIEKAVYALLAENSWFGPTMSDGEILFSSAHANVNGTGSALGVTGIDADRAVMARQKDISGNEYLALTPSILVVSTELGGTARVTNDAQYDPDTSGKLQRPNIVRGLFRDIVDTPHLSGNRRYLFVDPNVAPVIEVVFLEGQQEPFLEMQPGFDVDGVRWKVRLDYGVDAIDFRGAVTNAGQ